MTHDDYLEAASLTRLTAGQPSATDAEVTALETLAAALNPDDVVTTLVSGEGRVPHLSVVSRHAQIGEDIYAADGYFWWPWAERLVPLHDVPQAARKIAHVLGVT